MHAPTIISAFRPFADVVFRLKTDVLARIHVPAHSLYRRDRRERTMPGHVTPRTI
jgi:hypothetical protein